MQTPMVSISNLGREPIITNMQGTFDSGSQRIYVSEALCKKYIFELLENRELL